MTFDIVGEATYKCRNCGAKHFLHREDFDFEPQSSTERQMGQETQYVSSFDVQCHNCNSDILGSLNLNNPAFASALRSSAVNTLDSGVAFHCYHCS